MVSADSDDTGPPQTQNPYNLTPSDLSQSSPVAIAAAGDSDFEI